MLDAQASSGALRSRCSCGSTQRYAWSLNLQIPCRGARVNTGYFSPQSTLVKIIRFEEDICSSDFLTRCRCSATTHSRVVTYNACHFFVFPASVHTTRSLFPSPPSTLILNFTSPSLSTSHHYRWTDWGLFPVASTVQGDSLARASYSGRDLARASIG